MARILTFAIGLLVLGFFLPIWKPTYDAIMSNTTGVMSWGTYSAFELMIMRSAPIAVPVIGVVALLIYLGKREDNNSGY